MARARRGAPRRGGAGAAADRGGRGGTARRRRHAVGGAAGGRRRGAHRRRDRQRPRPPRPRPRPRARRSRRSRASAAPATAPAAASRWQRTFDTAGDTHGDGVAKPHGHTQREAQRDIQRDKPEAQRDIQRDSPKPSSTPSATSPKPSASATAPAPAIAVRPERVGTGETLVVEARTEAASTARLEFRGGSYTLLPHDGGFWGVFAVPLTAALGPEPLTVTLLDAAGTPLASLDAAYEVVDLGRAIDYITLTAEQASVLTAEASTREAELRSEQFAEFDREVRWAGSFAPPVSGAADLGVRGGAVLQRRAGERLPRGRGLRRRGGHAGAGGGAGAGELGRRDADPRQRGTARSRRGGEDRLPPPLANRRGGGRRRRRRAASSARSGRPAS